MAKNMVLSGSIYLAIYDDTTFRKKNPDALPEAIKSYEKSIEVSAGGKNEYKDQIIAGLQECALNSFNEGVTPYNEKDYQKAYNSFKQSADAYKYMNETFNLKLPIRYPHCMQLMLPQN